MTVTNSSLPSTGMGKDKDKDLPSSSKVSSRQPSTGTGKDKDKDLPSSSKVSSRPNKETRPFLPLRDREKAIGVIRVEEPFGRNSLGCASV